MTRIKTNLGRIITVSLALGAVGVLGYTYGYRRGEDKEKRYYQPVVESYFSDNERLRNLNKTYEEMLRECNRVLEGYERFLDEQRFQEKMREFQPKEQNSWEI